MSTAVSPATRRAFHPLPVVAVDPCSEDGLVITFAVPVDLRELYAFRAGQHVTVRRFEGGTEVRRSYSICSTPTELDRHGTFRIGVRRLPGGAFSGYAASGLCPGESLEILPPVGRFTTDFDPARRRHYAAIAAGSGITPILSLAGTALDVEPGSRVTLVYGNRTVGSTMFVDELADLKDRYPSRLHLVHVLSREPRQAPLLSGRLDSARLGTLLERLLDPSTVDEWFLCGPYGMVTAARDVLAERGVPEHRVHTELFHLEPSPGPGMGAAAGDRVPEVATGERAAPSTRVTMLLDGRESTFRMGRHERLLDAGLRARPELPYACRGGVCSTCRARLVSGQVTMAGNWSLEPDELAAGYVLTCQSSPVTDEVSVDYDA